MKMETPKMDVVRFQEADVLAASSSNDKKFATLWGWANGIDGDAKLTFEDSKTGKTTVHPYNELHQDPEMYDITFINGSNSSVSLTDLAGREDSYEDFNGNYERGNDGRYYWQ